MGENLQERRNADCLMDGLPAGVIDDQDIDEIEAYAMTVKTPFGVRGYEWGDLWDEDLGRMVEVSHGAGRTQTAFEGPLVLPDRTDGKGPLLYAGDLVLGVVMMILFICLFLIHYFEKPVFPGIS